MKVLRHKFNAKSCVKDEKKFPSKAEATYYQKLKLRQNNGEIVFFLRQPSFDLPGGCAYRADFVVFKSDGDVEFIDVKGFMTASSKMKIKMVEDIYPIKIKVVK